MILTLPYITLRSVDFADAGFGGHTTAGINELGMGTDSKVLIQYDRHFQRDAVRPVERRPEFTHPRSTPGAAPSCRRARPV